MVRHETFKPVEPVIQLEDSEIAAQNEWLYGPSVVARKPRAKSDTALRDSFAARYEPSEEEWRELMLATSVAKRTIPRAIAHDAIQASLSEADALPRYPMYADEAPEHLKPVVRHAILAASDLGDRYHWAPGDSDSGALELKTTEHPHTQDETQNALPAIEHELASK
jgi:hypothetical protein